MARAGGARQAGSWRSITGSWRVRWGRPGPQGPGRPRLGAGGRGRQGAVRGRAGFTSSDPEARRPLPAASPASGAGAGLARHLLHIDAAAAASRASRASPAPGMQRLWRAGPPGEGEGAIVAGPVPPPRPSFPVGVRAGGCGGNPMATQSCPEPAPLRLSPRCPITRPVPVAKSLGWVSDPGATSPHLSGPGHNA